MKKLQHGMLLLRMVMTKIVRRKMTEMIEIAPSRVATTKLGIHCRPPHWGGTGLWPLCLF
jgi:hypothetical protein